MDLYSRLLVLSTKEKNDRVCFMVKKVILSLFMVINIVTFVHYSIFMVAITDDALHQLVNTKIEHYVLNTVT